MKKSEARALLKELKERLDWVRVQKAKGRRLEAYALTHMAEDDIPDAQKVGMMMNYINYRNLGLEEDFLRREITTLEKSLTKS
jgi:hypothetical protein